MSSSNLVGFDESYDSIDRVTGTLTTGAVAIRKMIQDRVREAHGLEAAPPWPEALALWTVMHAAEADGPPGRGPPSEPAPIDPAQVKPGLFG